MPDSRLHKLSALGQSVWLDYLSRDLLSSGGLAQKMEEDAVTGVTSNPTIFQKAISQGNAYDDQMRDLLEHEEDPKEIFIALAGRDIGDACDLMRRCFDDGACDWGLGLGERDRQHAVTNERSEGPLQSFAARIATRWAKIRHRKHSIPKICRAAVRAAIASRAAGERGDRPGSLSHGGVVSLAAHLTFTRLTASARVCAALVESIMARHLGG